MTSLALDRTASAARRTYLQHIAATGGRARRSTAFLLFDTVAAIGFAAGLAKAVQAIVMGAPVAVWLLLAASSAIARGLCVALSTRSGAREAQRAKAQLRTRIVSAALDRSAGSPRTTGELLQSVVDEVEAIDGYVARFVPARRAAIAAPMIVLIATAIVSPVSAAILLVTLIPFVFAITLAGGAAADQSRRQFVALARLSGLFADRLRALPIILAFGAADRETERLADASRDVADRTMRVLRVAFLSSGTLEFFSALSVALVAVYCGFNVLRLFPFPVPEKLGLAEAFFVLALAPEFYAPLRRLAASYHDKQMAETAAERLAAVEAERSPSRPVPRTDTPPALYFDAVAIRYPGTDAPAVRDVNFHVAPGELIALLGPSGSGKSSLLRLLLGLSPLSDGEVRVNDLPLPSGGSLAADAAWLGQATMLLPASIRDNIALAYPRACRHAIERAAQAAGLGPMLADRELGLETFVDERGGGLSGGERRQVGLARALLKPAPLLLLDEPTAHLDATAEAAMIAAIRAEAGRRTILMATHSAAVAALADRVVVLEQRA